MQDALEMWSGALSHAAADQLAALIARAARVPTAMIHLAEGRQLRVIGGSGLPAGFQQMRPAPLGSTLAGMVLRYDCPLIIADLKHDDRVPADAPAHAVGIRAYAGFPVRAPDGELVGVCAVADYEPREWDPADLAGVDIGAQACTTLVNEQRGRQITEQQRVFLDTLLNSLDTGVAACDARGRLVVVNRSLRAALGVQAGEEPPEQWVPRLPVTGLDRRPLSVEEVPLIRAMAGVHVRGVEQFVDVPGDGRRLYRVNAHPILADDGHLLGAVSAFHDITVQRRAERLHAAELTVARVLADATSLEQAGPPVLDAIASALGWPYAELWQVDARKQELRPVAIHRAPGFTEALPVPDRLHRNQGLAGAAWQRGETVVIPDVHAPDSPVATRTAAAGRLCSALAVPVPSGGEVLAVISLFTDVAEDPQQDLLALLTGVAAQIGQFLERRRAERLQQALATSKDEYLNLVGHELRSPLTIIATYLDLVAEDPDARVSDILPMIDAMRRGSDRLRRLVDALLDLSALDSGHAQIQPVDVDLAALVAGAVRDTQAAATAKHLTLTADLPETLPAHADPARITQLVRILLDNAVAYTPAGGRIDVRVTATDTDAHIQVSDSGVGIPAHERPRVFERFHRGAITLEQAIPGAGLGLSLAQTIAERHHGHITVAPNHHRPGTTFHVHLPRQPAPEPP
ncbi:signal transduction histidine kinase [Krasilnikovia cinnamomea]|uniref:histidine kinase n=1 Tax=Krasilnikovia cinnamomea TaxID=349313 RepID=A0A4V2G7R5_9ACTN|nr:GAF domain-containing sensor histidine kinase [Krasilnikovia cinnamomea]RZU53586.1 signal transduction histidine kinase [Krasilnikovia cinnamomea]